MKEILKDMKQTGKIMALGLGLAVVAILALSIVATPLPNPEPQAIVSIENANIPANGQVQIPIHISSAKVISAGTVELSYDPSVIEVVSISDGDLGTVTWNSQNMAVTMTAYSTRAYQTDIDFAYITLKAKGNYGDNTWLRLRVILLADKSGVVVPSTVREGSATIIDRQLNLKGDVNGDGQANIIDALFIAQYTVGLRILPDLVVADMNGDNVVDVVDALLIAKASL